MTEIQNVLSIDVEEYFHALNLREACPQALWEELPRRVRVGTGAFLDLLDEHSVKATFFVLGWVAQRDPDLVREIASRGHEIASHGISHRTAVELGREGMRDEIVRSREVLSHLSGQEVQGFRASTFSVTQETTWVLDELIDAGYSYDSSIFPVRHDRYGIATFPRHTVRVRGARGSIVEIPPLTRRLLGTNLPAGGGGYLRIFPLGFHLEAIRRANREGHAAMIYLHPWELDPDQPRFRVGRFRAFRHYHHLEKTRSRVKTFLERFRFGTARALVERTNDGLEEVVLRGSEVRACAVTKDRL